MCAPALKLMMTDLVDAFNMLHVLRVNTEMPPITLALPAEPIARFAQMRLVSALSVLLTLMSQRME